MCRKLLCVFLCLVLLLGTVACTKQKNNVSTTEPAGDSNKVTENITASDYLNYDNTAEDISGTTLPTTQEIIEQSSTESAKEEETKVSDNKETTRKKPSTTKVSKIATTNSAVTTKPVQAKPSAPSVSVTSSECLHKNTTVKGKLTATAENDGYTGDTVCDDCGFLIQKGEKIEFIEEGVQAGMVQYPCPDGSFIIVPVGTNVFDYTMEKAGKTASHDYYELENEIFRLFNEERVRLGISAVRNNENAYYYVKTRAIEAQWVFSHTRPDGDNFSGVYEDDGIILCAMAENLVGHMTVQEGEDVAQHIFNAIMSSPSHKATALNSKYNEMSVAITYYDGQYYFCQHMYENVVH